MNLLFEFLGARTYAQIFGISLVIGAIYFFNGYDSGESFDQQIASLNQQLETEQNKQKDTDSYLKQVRDMQEKIGRLSAQYQEISRKLPTALNSNDLNKLINELGRNSGVDIKMKRPQEKLSTGLTEEIPVEVSMTGSFDSLAQFVYFVSSAERISRVKDIQIEPAGDGYRSKSLKLEGTVVGYKIASEKKSDKSNTEIEK